MQPRYMNALSGAVLVGGGILLLLLPAFLNRFPLVFPDTGAYLSVAWSRSWTLDRAGFYGLAFRPLSSLPAVWQLWIGVALQCAAIVAVLLMTMRAMVPQLSKCGQLAIIAGLAIATTLPWHSAQLMPDALTGICVLLTWLAVSRDPVSPGTPSVWLATVVTGIMHFTHLFLVPIASLTALACQAAAGTGARDVSRRAAAAAISTMLILACQVSANGLLLHRWTLDPVGSTFLFARLNEDGLVEPWMRNHCAEVPDLCSVYPQLPKDSQKLLWDTNSPFVSLIYDRLNTHTAEPFLAQVSLASAGSIRERPLLFISAAAKSTAEQLARFAPLDDECPRVCTSPTSSVYDYFRTLRPSLMPWFRQSAQFRGTLPKGEIRAVTIFATLASVVFLVAFAIIAWRRKDVLVVSLIATVSASLLANAAAAGALSDVHDRYQSRIVWLVPFVAVLSFVRLFRRANA